MERITDMSECDDEEPDIEDQNAVQMIHSCTPIENNNSIPRTHFLEKKLAELFFQIDKDNSGFLTRFGHCLVIFLPVERSEIVYYWMYYCKSSGMGYLLY